mmetsp:Transcript_57272/g.65292  ORF Transcript_57272/g.65292 Transcript_57272/m.65292 type:complete len:276 (-) Transcript_57272:185-1012(-)
MRRSPTTLRQVLLRFAIPIADSEDTNPQLNNGEDCPTIAEERDEVPPELSPSRTPSVFNTWLKGGLSSLGAQVSHRTSTILSNNTPKQSTLGRSEMSLLETNHEGHSQSLLLKLDDKATSRELSSIDSASLEGIYQEIILMGEADYALLFKNLAHALQPSAEFSILVVIPHKKYDIISRGFIKKGFGTNKIHEKLKEHASKHYLAIHNIDEKRAFLSKSVWREIYQRMLTQRSLWKSLLQSQRFPRAEESIPAFLASRLDCTVAVVRGQQSSLFR